MKGKLEFILQRTWLAGYKKKDWFDVGIILCFTDCRTFICILKIFLPTETHKVDKNYTDANK